MRINVRRANVVSEAHQRYEEGNVVNVDEAKKTQSLLKELRTRLSHLAHHSAGDGEWGRLNSVYWELLDVAPPRLLGRLPEYLRNPDRWDDWSYVFEEMELERAGYNLEADDYLDQREFLVKEFQPVLSSCERAIQRAKAEASVVDRLHDAPASSDWESKFRDSLNLLESALVTIASWLDADVEVSSLPDMYRWAGRELAIVKRRDRKAKGSAAGA